MKQVLAPALLIAALVSALAASAQTPSPAPSPSPPAEAGGPPPSGEQPILPGSLSGASASSPLPRGEPSPASAPTPPPQTPAPGPSTAPASRFHLHRPGTDVDGDLLTGNTVSNVYVFRGNVMLQSDPKIDREFGAATESDEPITITADEIDVDRFSLNYVAKGHVHFVQGSRSGRADVGMLNEQAHTLDLLGNADILDGDHRARAAKMHYNTADRKFHAAGDVRIYEPLPTPNPAASTAPPKRRRRLPI